MVHLSDGGVHTSVVCAFDAKDRRVLAALQPPQDVVIRGTCVGGKVSDEGNLVVELRNCQLAQPTVERGEK